MLNHPSEIEMAVKAKAVNYQQNHQHSIPKNNKGFFAFHAARLQAAVKKIFKNSWHFYFILSKAKQSKAKHKTIKMNILDWSYLWKKHLNLIIYYFSSLFLVET